MRAAIIVCLTVLITIVSSLPAPGQELAPSNLQASAAGSNVVITWHANGTTPPDAFRLEAGSGPGLADLAIVNIPWALERGLDAQFAAAGVAPGVYYMRVRAIRNNVASFPSEEVVMHVGTASCSLPNAPLNVTATVDSSRAVTLNWEAAARGGVAAGYVIEAGTNPGAPNLAIITLDSTKVSLLAAPGRYFVRLRAMGLCGASEPSREVEIIVP